MNQISMSGDVRGRAALIHLVDPQRNTLALRDGFVAAATGVTEADAMTAAVLRGSLEEYVDSGASPAPEYWAPEKAAPDQALHNLLGALPSLCVVRRSGPAPSRDRLAIAPAIVLRDIDDIELATLGVKAIASYVGLRQRETRLVTAAALAFGVNGLQHSTASPCGVVLCAGIDLDTSAVTVATVDMGAAAPQDTGGAGVLRAAIDTSRKAFGGLTHLPAFAANSGLSASMYLGTGTEEAFWSGRWRYDSKQFIPGWCSSLTIHRT
jgi:hypothetical protein